MHLFSFYFFFKCLISQKRKHKRFCYLVTTHTQLLQSKWQKEMQSILKYNSCCSKAVCLSCSLTSVISSAKLLAAFKCGLSGKIKTSLSTFPWPGSLKCLSEHIP